MSRPSIHQTMMEVAYTMSRRSTCLRRNVGCVLVNTRNHIIATGYNGVAAGLPHCNHQMTDYVEGIGIVPVDTYNHACSGAAAPSGTNLDSCQAIHAEQNALLQCKDVFDIYTAYCTTAPCITCVKLLMNTSCLNIVFAEDYPHSEASKALFLSKPHTTWHKIEN